MFTINQIREAHARVKSGADFPMYIQDLKKLGVLSYVHLVSDGQIVYSGTNNFKLAGPSKWPSRAIAPQGNAAQLKKDLKEHQQGQTTYPVFCQLAAAIGVEKWEVDIAGMRCIYFDAAGNVMLTEIIPDAS